MRDTGIRTTIFTLITAVALLGAACTSTSGDTDAGTITETSHLGETEIAPAFVVQTINGEFSLVEHLSDDGRPIFLNLWASWCYPCREEMPAIERSSLDYPDVLFIGVAIEDSREDAENFIDEIGITYIIGFDEEGVVESGYEPLGLPASYLISSDGVILERIFGTVREEDLAEKFEIYFGL